MNDQADLDQRRKQVAIDYFRLVDAGDPAVLDLFADDASMFFPKLGVARGKEQIGAFAQGIGEWVSSLNHDIDTFNVLTVGNTVVVEGSEGGRTASGVDFPDGVATFGLFCNVFEFDGSLISRMNVYVDPDFAGTHNDGVAWGKGVQASLGA